MKLRLLALGTLMVSLTSCFDVFETFNLKDDGSGNYEVKMDMSRGMGLFAMMKQGASSDKPKVKIDTMISYQSIVDTSSALSAEEKRVLRNSYTKVHFNEEDGEMTMQMYYPFANGKDFELVQKSMAKGTGSKDMMKSLRNVLGKQMDMPDASAGMEDDDKKGGLPTDDFSYTLTNGSLVRNVKPSSKPDMPKAAQEDMPPQIKEMMKMTFTTTVNLPRPVKTWKGKNGIVSADKKQLKFSRNLDLDSKPVPEDFNFSVDY